MILFDFALSRLWSLHFAATRLSALIGHSPASRNQHHLAVWLDNPSKESGADHRAVEASGGVMTGPMEGARKFAAARHGSIFGEVSINKLEDFSLVICTRSVRGRHEGRIVA